MIVMLPAGTVIDAVSAPVAPLPVSFTWKNTSDSPCRHPNTLTEAVIVVAGVGDGLVVGDGLELGGLDEAGGGGGVDATPLEVDGSGAGLVDRLAEGFLDDAFRPGVVVGCWLAGAEVATGPTASA
jgi:hypothetical protein